MNNKSRKIAFFLLEKWQRNKTVIDIDLVLSKLKEKDVSLIKEIIFGTIRHYLSLTYIYRNEIKKRPTSLKPSERLIFYMAFYQRYFMSKIPTYAIVNESVNLAKKFARPFLVTFFNAVLRKVMQKEISFPKDNLSIYYSYPKYFIDLLLNQYDMFTTKNILSVQNQFFSPMIRSRKEREISDELKIYDGITSVFQLKKNEPLTGYFKDSAFYVQNVTPVVLIENLSKTFLAKKVLDLCASPGGKLILAHDIFPNAKFYANDVSDKKIKRLEENLKKYQIQAILSISQGQTYQSNEKFDLIILDVPCSNSGVLHKRAEARWRITEKKLKELKELQLKLIQNASTLLEEQGQIWYLTCSILKEENEDIIKQAAEDYHLEILKTEKILPNEKGWDGGFGCALRKKHN